MILHRDFESKVDREQENRFLESNNISLFVDGESLIERIDLWSWKSIKKIIENKKYFHKVKATFAKWNNNIDSLVDNVNVSIVEIKTEPSSELVKAIENRSIFDCRKIIEGFDKNELFVNSKYVASKFLNDIHFLSRVDSSAMSDHISMKNVLNESILTVFGEDYE